MTRDFFQRPAWVETLQKAADQIHESRNPRVEISLGTLRREWAIRGWPESMADMAFMTSPAEDFLLSIDDFVKKHTPIEFGNEIWGVDGVPHPLSNEGIIAALSAKRPGRPKGSKNKGK